MKLSSTDTLAVIIILPHGELETDHAYLLM